jgi:hypothetical protein
MLPDRRFSNGSRPQSVNIAQSRSQMESYCWAKRYVTGAYLESFTYEKTVNTA